MVRKKQPRRRLRSHDSVSVLQRLIYLCDLLFCSSMRDMAAALKLNSRDLSRVFCGHRHPTVRLLAHVAAQLDVRIEWLVCGSGAVFQTDCETDVVQWPTTLQSSFPVFDPLESVACAHLPAPVKFVEPPLHGDPQPYLLASRAVYSSRIHNKLVGFFLGSDSFAYSGAASVLPFYRAGYANFLCFTLTAACFDLVETCTATKIDINSTAKLAATRGIGYGEALSFAAASNVCNRERSVLAAVSDMNFPAVVVAELGEISAHTAPGFRGAETGAAVGAAAYVDLLILTERLKEFFGAPGGVFLFAGEHERGVRLVLQRIESLRACIAEPAGFTFVVFAPHDRRLETLITKHGGHVIFLDHPTTAAFEQLFQTCNDVYAGKITHEHK